MTLSNKLYDALKWVTMILLPALATLYLTLGKIWGFPLVEQVTATITALTVFLGAVLQISNHNYKTTETESDAEDDGE